MKWVNRLFGKRDTLNDLILEAIAKKRGDNDFALFYSDLGEGMDWSADIGNPTRCVSLGEVKGEISERGSTPIEAVKAIIARMDSK